MKILLLGKGGQVGWELQRSLAPLGEIIALDVDTQDLCGDLSDLPGIATTIRAVAPHIIVNAAAHTAVDKAESEPELVRTINAAAPGVLAQEAIKAVPSSEFQTAAKRPLNSRLDCGKLKKTFDLELPDWKTGVERMLTEILEKQR